VDLSSLCELKSIALQAEKNLHHSLLVGVHHIAEGLLNELVVYLMVLAITPDVFKSSVEPDVVIDCLSLLDDHDLLYGIYYVEFHYVLTEFP
jgi:hypothetical protein